MMMNSTTWYVSSAHWTGRAIQVESWWSWDNLSTHRYFNSRRKWLPSNHETTFWGCFVSKLSVRSRRYKTWWLFSRTKNLTGGWIKQLTNRTNTTSDWNRIKNSNLEHYRQSKKHFQEYNNLCSATLEWRTDNLFSCFNSSPSRPQYKHCLEHWLFNKFIPKNSELIIIQVTSGRRICSIILYSI